MTTATPPTTPTVVIFDPHHEPAVPVSAELLRGAGHGVLQADSLDAALAAVARGGVELLVLSAPAAADHAPTLDRIALLPARVGVIALLSDAVADDDLFLRRKVPASKIVVLAGPIHAHGLLKVIRQVVSE
ncbi:MAG TPA: hypothetical protein VF624_18415 [Tepidisphaeraceae bacterium]